MVRVVVDTDIIIDYLRTGNGVLEKLMELASNREVELFVSSLTIFELFSGKSSKKHGEIINDWILQVKVIPVGQELAKLAGEVYRDQNIAPGSIDLIIAVTALSIGAQLATYNRKHFRRIPKLKFFKWNYD